MINKSPSKDIEKEINPVTISDNYNTTEEKTKEKDHLSEEETK